MTDPLLAKYGTGRDGHAIFAPSAAASWLTCSGSLLVNARMPDSAGEDAAYGTVAHWLAEMWLRTGEEPRRMLGFVKHVKAGGRDFAITIDEAMLAAVGRYVQWCEELPGDHFHEQRVDLSDLMPIPNQGGTADHFACERGLLTITDLKMGTGVRVYAEENPQAMLYATGAFLEHDWIYGFERIVIRICQPRLDVFDVWECSRLQLCNFMGHVRHRARLAWDEDARRTPTPKACRWCKGVATCPARVRDIERIVDDTFGDLAEGDRGEPASYGPGVLDEATPLKLPDVIADTGAIKALSTDALSYTLTFRKHVERWFAAVADELLDRVEKGERAPHWSLKKGRMARSWKDPREAAHYMHDLLGIEFEKIYPPEIISPAQAEELIGTETKNKPAEVKKALLPFVQSFAGRRTLALSKGDDREDVNDLIDQTFSGDEK